jgi:transcriptional regulator with XRE-family HTH domain
MISQESEMLDIVLKSIGRELIRLRRRKGYSSHASFADEYGLPSVQYWRMESGKSNITLKSLVKVLAIHNISILEFFYNIRKYRQLRSNKTALRQEIEKLTSAVHSFKHH